MSLCEWSDAHRNKCTLPSGHEGACATMADIEKALVGVAAAANYYIVSSGNHIHAPIAKQALQSAFMELWGALGVDENTPFGMNPLTSAQEVIRERLAAAHSRHITGTDMIAIERERDEWKAKFEAEQADRLNVEESRSRFMRERDDLRATLAHYKVAVADKLHFDMMSVVTDTPECKLLRERDAARASEKAMGERVVKLETGLREWCEQLRVPVEGYMGSYAGSGPGSWIAREVERRFLTAPPAEEQPQKVEAPICRHGCGYQGWSGHMNADGFECGPCWTKRLNAEAQPQATATKCECDKPSIRSDGFCEDCMGRTT